MTLARDAHDTRATTRPAAMAAPMLGDGGTGLRHLYPGYFALVMATGIVSTGLHLVGRPHASAALLLIAIAAFAVLCVLYAVRALRYRAELTADLVAPDRAYAFFTFVAACGVLGVRLFLDGHRIAMVVLTVVAAVAWTALSYGIPARLILGERPAPVLGGVNGTWFIWVVGTQSLAIAAAVLERGMAGAEARPFALAATLMWSVGVVLYLMVAALILIRLLLLEVRHDDLSPPYWIAMGATAITVLAAARLLQMDRTPVTVATRPMVAGLAVVLWAFGTWLVPMLVLFSFWRFTETRRIRYAPPLWSVVFPLGMYAAASLEIGAAESLPVVTSIGRVAAWVAAVVWLFVFVGMLHRLVTATLASLRR